MNKRTKNILMIVDLLLILLTVGFIFGNSLENAEKFTDSSDRVVDAVISTVPPVRDAVESKQLSLGRLESIIRSLAHVAEFILLGALTTAFLLLSDIRPLAVSAYLPFFFCLLVGIADECIQLTNDRACEVVDVLKDFAGSVIGGLLVFILYGAIRAIGNKRKNKRSE